MHSKSHYSGTALFVRSKLDDLINSRSLKTLADSHPSLSYSTLLKFRKNDKLVFPELVKVLMENFGLLDVSYEKVHNFIFPDLILNYNSTVNLILPSLVSLAKRRKLSNFAREHNLSYPTLNSLKNQKLPYLYPKFLLCCLNALGYPNVLLETDYIYSFIVPKNMKKLLTVNPLLYGSAI